MDNFATIQELLNRRGELQSRINLLPYIGTPEIKTILGKQYIYIRKRVLDKVTSTYVGEFNQILYNQLIKNNQEYKELNKQIKLITKELISLGFKDENIESNVLLNIEFARSNIKRIIYDQAVLEGVATTFPDTEAIIDNGKVLNMTANDVLKVINLKHAWEFILDKDVVTSKSDYYLSSYIAKLINEGFYQNGGRIRNVPVTIGGTKYVPQIPLENDVKEHINFILDSNVNDIDKAIELCLYVMRTQIYNDGNKRTAVIFANHYLIAHGAGLLIIDYEKVPEFKEKLISYYECKDDSIKEFLKACIFKMETKTTAA